MVQRKLGVSWRAQATTLVMAAIISACSSSVSRIATSDDIGARDNWPGHGRDSDEQRFSPLQQINAGNVDKLGLAWSLDLDEVSLEATPIEVDGVIYFSGGRGFVYAVDAISGKLLWQYDPELNKDNPREARLTMNINRGVAYWDGKVYIALKDGRMVAVNAKTGEPVWISRFLRAGDLSTSTGAPRIFNGKIIIGNSGAEFGARGYVTTLDAQTGKMLWRFFTVPGDPAKGFENDAMAMAAKTWSGEWWKYGGGGTPWNGISFDREFNQILIGTGNGGPWNGKFRSQGNKANLFLASVVAVDADSGQYKWHYQYNPNDVWDRKATSDIILADLPIGGQVRKVMMQAPSNGFFYIIDRQDGKLLSAEKIGKVNWADRIDLKSGLPVERAGIRYEDAPFTIYPNDFGAHNWQASSYNPNTGLVYIPYMQGGMTYSHTKEAEQQVTEDPGRMRVRIGVDAARYNDPNDPLDGKGSLLAWDPVAQKLRWRVDYPTSKNAGTMTTAGNLVFQGNNQGLLYAYDATNGQRLWTFDTKLGIAAPPITFSVKGKQYISLLVGAGGTTGGQQGWKYGVHPRRLLTFALDAKGKLPSTPAPDFSINPLDDPSIPIDPRKVERGQKIFYGFMCSMCHSDLAPSALAPDLRESAIAFDRDAFKDLLRHGTLISRGMPQYDDLTDAEMDDLYYFIREGARQATNGDTDAAQKGQSRTPGY